MRSVCAALLMVVVASGPGVARARAHRKAPQDPFGELFATKAPVGAKTHRGAKVARHHRRGPKVKLVAAVVPTAPKPMLVASNGPFVPVEFAPNRHALAGP